MPSFDAWWTTATVPPVGLGCWRLCAPGRPSWEAACRTIEAAYESGVRLFDTADSTPWTKPSMDMASGSYGVRWTDFAMPWS